MQLRSKTRKLAEEDDYNGLYEEVDAPAVNDGLFADKDGTPSSQAPVSPAPVELSNEVPNNELQKKNSKVNSKRVLPTSKKSLPTMNTHTKENQVKRDSSASIPSFSASAAKELNEKNKNDLGHQEESNPQFAKLPTPPSSPNEDDGNPACHVSARALPQGAREHRARVPRGARGPRPRRT